MSAALMHLQQMTLYEFLICQRKIRGCDWSKSHHMPFTKMR